MAEGLLDLEGAAFLRRDAVAEGYTDRAIAALVAHGEWHRLRRGAYCSGLLWRSLSTADRHRLLARAVLRTAHPSAVLTHHSAAIEHGAPVWGRDLGIVHLTRTDGRAGRREAGVVQHRGVLPDSHVVPVNGVRASHPTRVAVEMSTTGSVESTLVTVNGILHMGLSTPEAVATLTGDMRFWPRSLAADLVIRLADPRVESVGESRTLFLCWDQHLPRPCPQVEVRDERGLVVARLDFAWPEHGVFLEFDGREKYFRHRLEGEGLEEFLLREKRREELVCLLTGWVCIRISWTDLARRQQTGRRIRALLARRTSQGA